MQICLIRRLVNRESNRFGASEGVNIPGLYTTEESRSAKLTVAMLGCLAVAKVFWVVVLGAYRQVLMLYMVK